MKSISIFELLPDILKSECEASIINVKISTYIFELRNSSGMSKEEFSKIIGVSTKTLERYESVHYNFDIKTLCRICDKLNLKLSVDISKK